MLALPPQPLPSAAVRRRGTASGKPTSPRKTRVRGFWIQSPGRRRARRPQAAETASGCRPCGYETASGRGFWLSRDPIEEWGGLNLYGMVGNDPNDGVDVLGMAQIKFNVNWGDGLHTKANDKRFRRNIERLRSTLRLCCRQENVGCDVSVSFQEGGDDGIPVNMVPTGTVLNNNPMTIATGRLPLPGQATSGGPITFRIGAPQQYDTVLAHELGHVGGYNTNYETDDGAKNPEDYIHSRRGADLMSEANTGSGAVTKCACEALARNAK